MLRGSDLCIFFLSDLPTAQKFRILKGYLASRLSGSIKMLGMKLEYQSGQKSHSLLILKEIFLNQIYSFTESTEQRLQCKSSKKANGQEITLIDLGSNIGISLAYFKNKYQNIKIIAIEASPINYKQLIKNIQANKFENIVTINKFVSRQSGQIQFYHHKSRPGGSFGEGYRSSHDKKLVEFTVEKISIAEVIKDLKNLVIKIDVEGAEYEILENLALSENISEVMEITVEVSTSNLVDFKKLINVLNSFYALGFEPRLISNYSFSQLKRKLNQGHLQLILFKP